MKRYWVFAGECYYPGGGMRDFLDDFDTLEEAQEIAQKVLVYSDDENTMTWSWSQVYDTEQRKGVIEYGDNHGFTSINYFPT